MNKLYSLPTVDIDTAHFETAIDCGKHIISSSDVMDVEYVYIMKRLHMTKNVELIQKI